VANSIELKSLIEAAIPGAQAQVESPDDVHFTAHVVSDRFAGLSRVAQHQLVYEIFDGRLGGEIHALSLKTETP
jgi:acid stress-induced BolA-like protein IbaG/YrbA